MGQGEQGCYQRQGVRLRETVASKSLLEFVEFGVRCILQSNLQEPLEMLNERIERTVLMIGRTAKRQASSTLRTHLLFEFLDEARLANAGFPTEQHRLAFALLGPFPPLSQ
jgi:hypothetical protein